MSNLRALPAPPSSLRAVTAGSVNSGQSKRHILKSNYWDDDADDDSRHRFPSTMSDLTSDDFVSCTGGGEERKHSIAFTDADAGAGAGAGEALSSSLRAEEQCNNYLLQVERTGVLLCSISCII